MPIPVKTKKATTLRVIRISVLQSIYIWLPSLLFAQATTDTLFRYDNNRFLIKTPIRFELKDKNVLIDWWENMNETIKLDNKTYHLIKRKENETWKTGLFNRREGKLLITPQYDKIYNFFYSQNLVLLKINNGYFLYSMKNGIKTNEPFQKIRQFGKDALAIKESEMVIYSNELELKDRISGLWEPAMQVANGTKQYIFLHGKDNNVLMDEQYQRSSHPEWKNIYRLEGKLLLVEGEKGRGIYHLGQKRLLTSLDHEPNIYELHESRFVLYKSGNYILYDSTGKKIVSVRADGMSCVDNLKAFFYRQDLVWKIMNSEGKILKTPVFDDFDQSKASVGNFIARVKGEKKHNLYEWVYSGKNGQKIISGIKLLGEYKENDPVPQWLKDQPVPEKHNR